MSACHRRSRALNFCLLPVSGNSSAGVQRQLSLLLDQSAASHQRPLPLQGRCHSPAQSWKSSGGRTRHGVQRIKSRGACFPRESRGLVNPPIRPSRSRQGLDEACRTFGGRQSAATSAGSSPGCSAHRRNAMGMARRLGVPLASESSGQRLASSVQQEESHSCFERDGIGSYALAEVRSIVA